MKKFIFSLITIGFLSILGTTSAFACNCTMLPNGMVDTTACGGGGCASNEVCLGCTATSPEGTCSEVGSCTDPTEQTCSSPLLPGASTLSNYEALSTACSLGGECPSGFVCVYQGGVPTCGDCGPLLEALEEYADDTGVDLTVLDDGDYERPLFANFNQIINPVAKIIYYAGLAIGVLAIIYSGYLLMASEGDPAKVKEAQEQLTSSIFGIIFLLLASSLIRIIITNILT